jgi:hypothetical protein
VDRQASICASSFRREITGRISAVVGQLSSRCLGFETIIGLVDPTHKDYARLNAHKHPGHVLDTSEVLEGIGQLALKAGLNSDDTWATHGLYRRVRVARHPVGRWCVSGHTKLCSAVQPAKN